MGRKRRKNKDSPRNLHDVSPGGESSEPHQCQSGHQPSAPGEYATGHESFRHLGDKHPTHTSVRQEERGYKKRSPERPSDIGSHQLATPSQELVPSEGQGTTMSLTQERLGPDHQSIASSSRLPPTVHAQYSNVVFINHAGGSTVVPSARINLTVSNQRWDQGQQGYMSVAQLVR
jgi:hypothetical protein